jgi:uncharacterized protein (DUF1697 family)
MGRYVALLRGVNVGGNNKIAMPGLRAAFERAGFADVTTYINSGNVFFSAPDAGVDELQRRCGRAIEDGLGMAVALAVLSAEELRDAMEHAPPWWGEAPDAKHNALFVIAPASAEDVVESIGAHKPELERIAAYGQVIFWSAPIATYSRTRLSKIVGTAPYASVTIRNANTARKLRQLVL